HDAFIITKGGVRWESEQGRARARTWCDNSPDYLARAIEDSLRRLRIDVIPLYFVHWPDESTSLPRVLDALREARHRGRIQGYGLANFAAEAVLECGPATGIEAVQASYNLLSEDAELEDLYRFGWAGFERYGYGALAQGLLTGKYGPDTRFGDDDRRHRLTQFEAERWPRAEALLGQLGRIAECMGRNVAQVALQAARQSGFVEHVIVGIKSPEQVHDLCGLGGWRLAEGDLRALMNAARQPARTVAG
ncbi:MAG TPA: aldo/keto reductase, partial [Croceibacterium sp.]